MTTSDTAPDCTTEVLDWLAAPPSAAISDEIALLRRHQQTLSGPGFSPVQQHRCIELFFGRALRIAEELKPRLIESGLPLSRPLHASAKQVTDALVGIAEGFLRTLSAVQNGTIRPQRLLVETLAARGLRLLGETLEIWGLAGGGRTLGQWSCACALFAALGAESSPEEPGESGGSALFAFRRLLALGSLQLECFSQNEVCWICDYLGSISSLLQIENLPPANPDAPWYWLARDIDESPHSLLRKPCPATAEGLLFFSSHALAKRVAEQLAQLDSGQQPFELNLPKLAVGVQPVPLLQRLRNEWVQPSQRGQPRRKAGYAVQACTGLLAIWKVLRSEAPESASIHEWQVLNESQGGYSIMHVANQVEGLCAGMAVALRPNSQAPWSVCVVRWIRSDAPTQIELGLQVVSIGASPVSVGFRASRDRPTRMVNALVLPTTPDLRKHPAILAPAGTYTSRRFALVSDLDRLYIAQGRLLSLDMQTANIELFQFEIDPYPI